MPCSRKLWPRQCSMLEKRQRPVGNCYLDPKTSPRTQDVPARLADDLSRTTPLSGLAVPRPSPWAPSPLWPPSFQGIQSPIQNKSLPARTKLPAAPWVLLPGSSCSLEALLSDLRQPSVAQDCGLASCVCMCACVDRERERGKESSGAFKDLNT